MQEITGVKTSNKVIELISMYTDIDSKQISEDTALRTLGLDSLGIVSIIAAVQEEFGIVIDLRKHKFPSTFAVGDMANMIETLQGKDIHNKNTQDNIQKSVSREIDDQR